MQNRLLQWINEKFASFIPQDCEGCAFQTGMQEAVQDTQELFLTIADSMPVPLVISSLADGTILYCNDLCRMAFGLTASESLHRQKAETLYNNPAERQELLDILAVEGLVREAEVRLKKADGTLFWATVSMRYLTLQSEKVVLSVFCDITERKRVAALEQELLGIARVNPLAGPSASSRRLLGA